MMQLRDTKGTDNRLRQKGDFGPENFDYFFNSPNLSIHDKPGSKTEVLAPAICSALPTGLERKTRWRQRMTLRFYFYFLNCCFCIAGKRATEKMGTPFRHSTFRQNQPLPSPRNKQTAPNRGEKEKKEEKNGYTHIFLIQKLLYFSRSSKESRFARISAFGGNRFRSAWQL